MLRKEQMHYTREQVAGHLDDALAIVAEVDPPEDLRAITFEKAVNLLSAKQVVFEQPAVGVLGVPRPVQ